MDDVEAFCVAKIKKNTIPITDGARAFATIANKKKLVSIMITLIMAKVFMTSLLLLLESFAGFIPTASLAAGEG